MADFNVNMIVSYKSQWDADASETRDDCGPCSIAMILNYFENSSKFSTNDIFKKTGAGKDQLISIQQMLNAIVSCGYEASYYTGQSVESLKGYLDAGLPVLPLIHYGAFTSRQDQGYAGGHFFVVVGYRDDGYLVNDPDFYSPRREEGDHHFYTKADFEKGWSTCSRDGNPNNSFIVIKRKNIQSEINYEKLYNECRIDRDERHNDRMALYNEMGFDGDFNRTLAIEKIIYYKGLDAKLKERDIELKSLRELLAEAKIQIEEATKQLEELKKTHSDSATATQNVETKVDQATNKIDSIEEKIGKIINEEPMKGFFAGLWELIQKHFIK